MNRRIRIVIGLLLLVMLAGLYFVYAPARSAGLGPVSVTVTGYQTNATGQVTALVAITNSGMHLLNFAVGTQILQRSAWVDSVSGVSNHLHLNVDPDPQLVPGSDRLIFVPVPPSASNWRVLVSCQKYHWSRRPGIAAHVPALRWFIEAYVLKWEAGGHFYSEEIQR